MPEVTYTADGGHYRVDGHGFDPGDTKEVDAELAEYLAGLEEFEVEGGNVDAGVEDDVDDSEDEADAKAEPDDEFDIDAFLDRTPVEDVAEDIRAGEADDHLDAVGEAAERVTVQDAIGERRAELEG